MLRVGAAYAVAAWLLIQVAETIFPLFGFDDTPARIVVIVLAIGFVPSMIFAWIFELTPDGLIRDKEIDRSRFDSTETDQKLDRAIIIVLMASLSYFAFDKFVLDPARDAEIEESAVQRGRSAALVESYGENSIAVLPFVNMSDDASNEYFSDGMSEELLNLLSKIPKLRVVSRSSSFTFKGKDIDIPTIAEQLDVRYVLEGSVRKAGSIVRITAQLIEARSDTHLWSETYDSELIDVFAVQDDISAAIVAELKGELTPVTDALSRGARTNTDAHEAYLRGRYLVSQRKRENVEAAIREFHNAVSLDPDYALAHAELSLAYMIGYADISQQESEVLGAHHAELAMSLDPSLAESQAAAGFSAWYPAGAWEPGHLEEAIRYFENAVRINPSYSDAYNWMGNILEFRLGRYKEAFEVRKKAVRLDPLSVPANNNYISGLLHRNRFAEADRAIEKYRSFSPGAFAWMRDSRSWHNAGSAHRTLAILDSMQTGPELIANPGRRAQALGILARELALMSLYGEALAVSQRRDPWIMIIVGRLGDLATEALAILDEDPDSPLRKYFAGQILAGAGDYGAAMVLLEDSWQLFGSRVVPIFPVEGAVALAVIRRSAGENEDVDDLIAAIRDDVQRKRDAGLDEFCHPQRCTVFGEGIAAYLSGDYEEGLSLIGEAVESGYFVSPNQAYLQALYDDPGFGPILDVQQDRQQRERDKFLAIVCTENPYAAFWQPEDQTCERYVTVQRELTRPDVRYTNSTN